MEEYFLPIHLNGKINSVFVKANSALIQKHKTALQSIGGDINKCKMLEELWKVEYNGIIKKVELQSIIIAENWTFIEFLKKSHYTMFMLKWS